MKALLPLALLGALALASAAHAQDAVPASATWALTASTAPTATEGAMAASAARGGGMVVRDYTGTLTGGGGGPLGPFARWWLDGGAVWPDDNAPNPNRYVQFAVAAASPTAGPLSVTDISLVLNAGGTGALRASLFYDTDPAFSAPTPLATDLAVSRDAVTRLTYTITQDVTGTDSLYVRIYPWVRSTTTGSGRYLFVQDVSIAGTTPGAAPPPEDEGAYWALTESTDVTEIVGDVAALPARASALVVRDYIGTLLNGSGGPLGPYQRWWLGGADWPDDNAPNPDRYVEFVVAPVAGMDFAVEQVSLIIGAGGTSAMRASVRMDTDPAFTAPTILAANLEVSRTDVQRLTYAVDTRLTGTDSLYVRVYPWVRSSTVGPGRNLFLQDVSVTGRAEAGTAGEAAPPAARLLQSFPNPARGAATVRYELAEPAAVEVALYDALGRRVALLAQGPQAAGRHEHALDARALPAGVYLVRLVAGAEAQTSRLTVVR